MFSHDTVDKCVVTTNADSMQVCELDLWACLVPFRNSFWLVAQRIFNFQKAYAVRTSLSREQDIYA